MSDGFSLVFILFLPFSQMAFAGTSGIRNAKILPVRDSA
jgi:hypothetical protein